MLERVNDEAGQKEASPDPGPSEESKDEVQEQSEESFPASDPPSY